MPPFASNASLTLETFDPSLANTSSICDLTRLSFVDAYGLVGTVCALLSGGPADLPDLRLPRNPATQRHLQSMGFAQVLREAGYPFAQDAEPIDRPDVLVPLSYIKSIHAAEQLSHLLFEQISDQSATHAIEPLTEGLWELTANALEHSGVDAFLMGQVYRRAETRPYVQIVVGDVGKGIRQSFLDSGAYEPPSDAAAIHLALEYLISSVPDTGRGQGLTTTAEGVIAWGGSLVVRSGTARVDVDKARRHTSMVPELNGTLVAISLPL
jgi:hypothetical protein